jgi:hypothetical protein
MLQGSSNLERTVSSNVVTPVIRATLFENIRAFNVNYPLLGTTTIFGVNQFIDSVFFKGLVFLYGSSALDNNTIFACNVTLVSTSTILLGGANRLGKFYVEGSTLHLFYVNGDRNVYRISTGDGSAWSGATLLSSVASGSSFVYLDVQPVALDEYYVLRGTTRVISTYPWLRGHVYYHNVASGVSRLVYSKALYLNEKMDERSHSLVGGRVDGKDTLIVHGQKAAYSIYLDFDNESLRSFTTDTINVFQEKEYFETGKYHGYNMSALARGASFYYLTIKPFNNYYTLENGITTYRSDPLGPLLIRSVDLNELSVPMLSPFSLRLTDGGISSVNTFPVGMGGGITLGYEFMQLYPGLTPSVITNGMSPLDISNDILSYRNDNNKRITLELGNYR